MRCFEVCKDDLFNLSSTSKGNQLKWFKNNFYIKADSMGYEGIAEVLVSELLLHTHTNYDFINYFLCSIRSTDRTLSGCYSVNYLKENESFISLYRLLQLRHHNLGTELKRYNGKDLVNFVIEETKHVSGVDITDYLGFMIRLDALILNEDRHLNNINLIYDSDTEKYRLAPIFDNGLSLLSDIRDYPLIESIGRNINHVKSKPFSTSFKKQVSYINSDLLVIDFDGLDKALHDNADLFVSDEYRRARQVLIMQLRSKEGILWRKP